MRPAPAVVYVLSNGLCRTQLQRRSADASLQRKDEIIQAQGVRLRAGQELVRELYSKVAMLEASGQQADQQLGHMAHELATANAKYAVPLPHYHHNRYCCCLLQVC